MKAPLVPYEIHTDGHAKPDPKPEILPTTIHRPHHPSPRKQYAMSNKRGVDAVGWFSGVPRCIATISAGFEKGDFLVREEKGQRVYFDFFEEAFNYIAAKGYARMPKMEEAEWLDLMETIHASVKGGMKYNTGRLLMVLHKPLVPAKDGVDYEDPRHPRYGEEPDMDNAPMLPMP